MTNNIDFSQIDLIIGVVIGAAALVVVGFMFWRAKVVRFSWEKGSSNDEGYSNLERRYSVLNFNGSLEELKVMIVEMRQDIKGYLKTQQDCQKELPEKYVMWEVLNNRILDKLDIDRKLRWAEYDRHKHDPRSGGLIKS